MVVALPYENGVVGQHFGRAQAFLIARVSDGTVLESGVFGVEGLQHDHSGLAGFLLDNRVDIVIAGNMGPPMREALRSAGLQILCGAAGDAHEALVAYLAGDFQGGESACGHEHGHLGHEHPGQGRSE